MARLTGTLHVDQHTFFIISCSIVLRIFLLRIFPTTFVEKIKTLILCSKTFFFENLSLLR